MQMLDKGQNRTICKYEKVHFKLFDCKTQNLEKTSQNSLAECPYLIYQSPSTSNEDFNL